MSARKDLIESIESALNFNKEGAEKFFDKVVLAIKEEIIPKDQTFQEFFGLDEKPELIQGYTAEQWQEVIDGGYLVEVRDFETQPWVPARLTGFRDNKEYGFLADGTEDKWSHCRPAQIKGVMRPIFVEPVDKKNSWSIFFDNENKMVSQGTRHHPGENQDSFEKLFEETCKRMDITKYIEL